MIDGLFDERSTMKAELVAVPDNTIINQIIREWFQIGQANDQNSSDEAISYWNIDNWVITIQEELDDSNSWNLGDSNDVPGSCVPFGELL